MPPPTQHKDAPLTDLLDHRRNVGIAGRLACDKPGLEAHGGTIEVDALKKEDMEMQMHIQGAAKALEKGDRARVDGGPLVTLGGRLVDVILPDGGANDRMDLGG